MGQNKIKLIAPLVIFFVIGFITFGLINKNVEPNLALAETVMNTCLSETGRELGKETCYSIEFLDIARERGPEFAFKTLDELQVIDSDARGCHLISHGIGRGTYERDPENWKNHINSISPSCNYGAIHGILEMYINTLPGGKLTREAIPGICGESPRADCNHIMGHLILVQTKGNIDEGLDLCSVFKDKPTQLNFCYTGVFMEYQTALNLIEHGLAPKSWLDWPSRVDELENTCRRYDGEKGVTCWMEIVHAALVKFKHDPKTIFDFCSTSPLAEGAEKCRRHAIGIMAANKQFDLNALAPMCALKQKNDPNFESDCYSQLVGSMLSTLPKEIDRAIVFCDSIGSSFKKACFTQLGYAVRGLKILTPGQVEDACKKAPDEFQNSCRALDSNNQDSVIYRND